MNARVDISELDRLRARVAELEDEVEEWRRQYGDDQGFRDENRASQWESDAAATLRVGLPIKFSRGEWCWLTRILASAGTVVGHESLRVACLMPGGNAEGTQVAKVYGCRVRAKLREARAPGAIKTVWGIGYVIEPSQARELKAWLGIADA